MHLKAFLGDTHHTQWLNLLYFKAEMQHFPLPLRLSPLHWLSTMVHSSIRQCVIFPLSKHHHTDTLGTWLHPVDLQALSKAHAHCQAGWPRPISSSRDRSCWAGVSTQAEQLLALFSCQKPSLGNARVQWLPERQELSAFKVLCLQTCHLPLSEPSPFTLNLHSPHWRTALVSQFPPPHEFGKRL